MVRLSAMGDLIHAIAAASSLRTAAPERRIGWVVEARWLPLLCAPGFPPCGERADERPLADDVFPLSIRSWRSRLTRWDAWRQIRAELAAVKQAGYETAVDLQGSVRSAVAARLSGAVEIWGEANPRETLASIFHRRRVPVSGNHVIEHNLSLLSAMAGVPLRYRSPLLPRDHASVAWCEELLARLLAKAGSDHGRCGICILSPGAGWGAKCWPAASFARVARELAEAGIISVVNYGPGEEELARAVVDASEETATAVACSVSQLIELTRRAELFIGGDTGPMHLAAALEVPVVALFGPTNPLRNGPYGTRSVVLRSGRSATSYRHTSQPDEALRAISPAEVVQAARRLLQKKDRLPQAVEELH
jgi:heptosyltransferase-1